MADDRLIDSFKRNATEEVRATLRTYRGRQYLDIRIYYMDDQGEFRPTKKGVNLSVDLMKELRGMVDKLTTAVAEDAAAAAAAEAAAPPADAAAAPPADKPAE